MVEACLKELVHVLFFLLLRANSENEFCARSLHVWPQARVGQNRIGAHHGVVLVHLLVLGDDLSHELGERVELALLISYSQRFLIIGF
jgi:hypothetical protein